MGDSAGEAVDVGVGDSAGEVVDVGVAVVVGVPIGVALGVAMLVGMVVPGTQNPAVRTTRVIRIRSP